MAAAVCLANGSRMPVLGLGTWQVKGVACKNAVLWALREGCRHIDTAAIYQNEAEVAQAIAESGVPREDVYITTKLSPYDQGYEEAKKALATSLQNLRTSYVDLYLMHWPGKSRIPPTSEENRVKREASWRAMEEAYEAGLCRAIGVSNFTVSHMQELLATCRVPPSVNQVELHPALQQRELVQWCRERGVQIEAYSPLGVGHLLKEAAVLSVAGRRGASPAQVLIRWGLQKGYVVIPRSAREEGVRENWASLSVQLTAEDVREMDGIEEARGTRRFCWDPSGVR
eukprot:tig00021617_g22946.t1